MSLFSKRLDRSRAAFVYAALALGIAVVADGCGAGYRPVVTPINPSGPSPQPTSLAVVISSPAVGAPGVASIIDYSGDTIVAQSPIGVGPIAFTLDQTGSTGYTLNSDATVTNFPASSNLQQKNVTVTTLPSTAVPVNMFSPSAGLWMTDLNGNLADVFTGSPQDFKLSIPVAANPVMVIGPSVISQRNYVIAQGAVASGLTCNTAPASAPLGEADAIEVTSNTISARIPLGRCPVYAVQSPDAKRLFVLNRGSDTITVINSQNNTLNACTPFLNQLGQLVTCHPTLPLSTSAISAPSVPAPPNGTAGMGSIAGPVTAEYNAATQQLVVANYDGGSISVIDVSLDQYGNDSATFGTTFTIPVGNTSAPNPSSVTVLYDGSRAYTANQNDGTTNGTVTVVNLLSHTVEKTVQVTGHPRTVVSTQNSLQGKVYAAAPDSPYITIIRTDQDIVDATVLVQGNVLDVRVTTQNAVSGNVNNTSRTPGFGQPCYLPPPLEVATYGANFTLQNCATLP
jgi:DNA-binding beta-propeller fold protein YncE